MNNSPLTAPHLINIISNKLKRSADENLVEEKVTVEQVMILKMIYKNGGSVLQKDIEKEFRVRRSTVTSAMQNLEKKGFIARASAPDDLRSKVVSLTEKGKEKNETLWDFIKKRDAALLENLSEEEQMTLTYLLQKLLDNIK